MSASPLERNSDLSSFNRAIELKYGAQLELLRNRYSEYVEKVISGETSPGPGRLFYESPYARSHVSRFQVGILGVALEEVFNLDMEHQRRVLNRRKAIPMDLMDFTHERKEVVTDFKSLEIQALNQYKFFKDIVDSDFFPVNLYNLDNFTINEDIYDECMRRLQMTRSALSEINDYNLDGRVSSMPMRSKPNEDNILSTGYSLILKLEGMAWNFSNNLNSFTYNSERNSNILGAILRSYHGDLDEYIVSNSDNYDFRVPVKIFNMYGPFAFLEKILTLTKHTAELCVGSTTFAAMLENGLTE